ncbi:MAG: flagellar biosynthesis anti-sigma factor FlgM [Candidatus Latescibacterota bacterium]
MKMRIDGLSHQLKISQAQQRNAPARGKNESERADDVVEISKGAQDVSDLSALARSEAAETNPRINEIKQRVESGYYDSRQVREQIADSLLESDGLKEAVSDIGTFQVARQQLDEVPEVRAEKVDDARQRVGNGFYDRAEVRLDTADKILDEMA